MKKLLLILILALYGNIYSADYWVQTGTMSPANNDWVYALSSHNGNLFASSWAVGIYKGEGSSAPWNFSGLNGKRVSDLFTAPNGDIYGYSHTTSIAYIHRSTDNGVTWQDVYTRSLPNNYAGGGGMVFPGDGSIVAAFAYTQGPTVGDVSTLVLKSTDGGNNWEQKANIRSGFVGGLELLQDGRIWIGSSLSGVFQSTNNGNNWATMTNFPPIYIHDIMQSGDGTIYVCDAYGPNRSTDNGQTFVDISAPSPAGYMIEASFVDSKGNIYLSYDHDDVYRSKDKGNTWDLLTSGIPGTTWICSFTEANGKIYAGTRSNGTLVLTNGVTSVITGNEIVTEYKLKQNYPNPFNPSTLISYELPVTNFMTLKVYDLNGKEVANLVNGVQPAGKYSVNFNANNLSAGTYFYKLESEGFSETKKMILVK